MDSLELEEANVNDNLHNDEEYELPWYKNTYVHVLFFIIYLFIFIFGLTGNLLVTYSVLRHKPKQTVVNVFMFNLAVANILNCLFVMPIEIVHTIANTWSFGWFMCHLWPLVYHSQTITSMLTLASMAVYRYLTIVHPLARQKMTKRKLMITIVIMWLVSLVASLPFGIFHTIEEYTYHQKKHDAWCVSIWPSENGYKNYHLTTFVMFLVIPTLVTASSYITLSIKMSTNDDSTRIEDKRTDRLLMAMTTALCVCLLPFHIVHIILMNSDWSNISREHLVATSIVVDVAEKSWTCVTPLFYVWLKRITFKQFILVGPCCKSPSLELSSVDGVDATASTYTVLSGNDRADDVTYNARCQSVNLVSIVGE